MWGRIHNHTARIQWLGEQPFHKFGTSLAPVSTKHVVHWLEVAQAPNLQDLVVDVTVSFHLQWPAPRDDRRHVLIVRCLVFRSPLPLALDETNAMPCRRSIHVLRQLTRTAKTTVDT